MIESVHRFSAMGTTCAVTITAVDERSAQPFAARSERVVAHLESLWSRFRPGSELMVLNEHAGSEHGVSPDTFALLAAAVEAWRVTDGRFDPTMLEALVSAGYDRSFELLVAEAPIGSAPPPPRPGPDAIRLDAERAFVTLPAGVHLDLGGIAKGRTADIVAMQLERDGVAGACVDLGGDIAVFGVRADARPWAVAIEDPTDSGSDLACIGLDRGAVATSSIARRRWTSEGAAAHHLIDPRTRRPAVTDLVAVSVVAAEAMWAEVFAKAALIAGSTEGRMLIEDAGLSAVFVTAAGEMHDVGAMDQYLLPLGATR